MPLSDDELELLDSWIALLKDTLEVRLFKRLIAEVRASRAQLAAKETKDASNRV